MEEPLDLVRWIFAAIYRFGQVIFQFFEGLGRVLYVGRVSIVVVLAMMVLLGVMPQGREIGFAVVDRTFMFFLPVVFCTLVCWLWFRILLNQEFGPVLDDSKFVPATDIPLRKLKCWVEWLPRLLGALPAFGALASVVYAWRHSSGDEVKFRFVVYAVIVSAALIVFVWRRRKIADYIANNASQRIAVLFASKTDHRVEFSKMSSAMRWSVILAALLPLIVVIPGLFAPAKVGQWFGPTASVFAPTALLVSMLSGAIFLLHSTRYSTDAAGKGKPSYKFPVILIALALSLLFTAIFDGDRFVLRTVERGPTSQSRPELRQAVREWIEKAKLKLERDQQKGLKKDTDRVDMVVVATAGGALRAAMWTGSILGILQDRVPDFETKLGAVSAVSGGALGAVAYQATLWEKQNGARGFKCQAPEPCFERRIQAGLSGDFLAPAMLGLVSNDVALTLIGPVTKDRAEALEGAWELSWENSAPELPDGTSISNAMSNNFLGLWEKDSELSQPALFLNGTHQELGNRIITSNLKIGGRFVDAVDFFTLHAESIPTSTAAHNSARFPYISPTGEIKENHHIVDGGYFENYGAETALEFAWLVKELDTEGAIRMHILQIVSNPKADRSVLLRPGYSKTDAPNRKSSSMFLGQYSGPLQGILKTREARGIHAAVRLYNYATALSLQQDTYHLINMGDDYGNSGPALSWYMPNKVREDMVSKLTDCSRCSGQVLNGLIGVLGGSQFCGAAQQKTNMPVDGEPYCRKLENVGR